MAIQSKVRRLQPISKNVLSQEKQRKPEKQSKPGKKQGQGKSLAAPGRPDTEQVKARLMQSPNVPKRKEKFHNFVKNTYKVQDEKMRSELWDWWQKHKKH